MSLSLLSHGWLINLNPGNAISKHSVEFWFRDHNVQFVMILLFYVYRKIACLTILSFILFSFIIAKLIIDNQSSKI